MVRMTIFYEYKKHKTEWGDATRVKHPIWVKDGGHWTNSVDFTMIGVQSDVEEWYLPDTLNFLTPQELEDRQVAIHTANPMMKYTDEPSDPMVEMTEAEVRTAIQDWVTSKA